MKRMDESETDVAERSMVTVNNHHQELYTRNVAHSPFQAREFHSRRVWQVVVHGTILIVSVPMDGPYHPALDNVVRAKTQTIFRLSVTDRNETKIECVPLRANDDASERPLTSLPLPPGAWSS